MTTTSDILKRCQQIVDQYLRDTIPKSIDDTKIQYKTVVSYSSLVPLIKIYLKTSTENNENLCKTFCISINIPLVTKGEGDVLLSYLSDTIGCTIESFLVRLTKGILANDLTTVADTDNNILSNDKIGSRLDDFKEIDRIRNDRIKHEEHEDADSMWLRKYEEKY